MERFRGVFGWCMNFLTAQSLWQQDLKRRDLVILIAKVSGIMIMTSFLFYRSLLALIPLMPVGIWYLRMMMGELLNKKESEFQMQFREMILSLSASLNVGYSVENALRETQKELGVIFPEDARISRELLIMTRQLRLQMPMERVFREFAMRVDSDEVRSFVTVFVSAKRTGGDMIGIIQDTAGQIGDKIDVKREISTVLAAKKYEFKVMSWIPYGIIAYMMLSFPEFMDVLYGNLLGIGVMTICLAAYLGAYYLGIRIVNIEI